MYPSYRNVLRKDPLYSSFVNLKKIRFHPNSMRLMIKLMERMVSQNVENEIYHDFKYWEDCDQPSVFKGWPNINLGR